MNELYLRIFSSIFLLLLFTLMIFGNKLIFTLLIQIFQFICVWEYLRLVKFYYLSSKDKLLFNELSLTKTKLNINEFFLIFLFNALNVFLIYENYFLFQIFLVLIVFIYFKFFFKNLINLTGLLYVLSPFFIIITLKSHIDFQRILLFIVFFSILVDSSAYFFGKKIGGIKLAFSISPNKTVAGFLAGIVFPTLVCIIFYSQENIINVIIFSIIFSVTIQIGDLIESKFKRICNVKDSSNVIPGHGGALDRMDGIFLFLILISLFIILDYNLFFIR